MIQFLQLNWRYFLFGLLMTSFSSLGQTYLVSLFVPSFLQDLDLTKSGFGTLYAAATLVGAFLLPTVGAGIDRMSLRRYTVSSCLGIVFFSLLMSTVVHPFLLFLSLVGLRMLGQGIFTHISATTMARSFDRSRGKALMIAGLGYPLAESFVPAVLTSVRLNIGWKMTWVFLAGVVLVLLIPLVTWLTGSFTPPYDPPASHSHSVLRSARHWQRSEVLRDYRFYLLLPASVMAPCLLTGFLLYQTLIAELKGWSLSWMASAFTVYAVMRLGASLCAGPLVDRFGAVQILPFALFPVAFAFVGMSVSSHSLMAFLFLGLAGLTTGLSGSVKTAFWAEVYGTAHLGAIRSFLQSTVAFATAIGPVFVGMGLDGGLKLETIFLLSTLVTGLAILGAFISCRLYRKSLRIQS